MVDRRVSNDAEKRRGDPSPEDDRLGHLVALHLRFHLDVEDLQVILGRSRHVRLQRKKRKGGKEGMRSRVRTKPRGEENYFYFFSLEFRMAYNQRSSRAPSHTRRPPIPSFHSRAASPPGASTR